MSTGDRYYVSAWGCLIIASQKTGTVWFWVWLVLAVIVMVRAKAYDNL